METALSMIAENKMEWFLLYLKPRCEDSVSEKLSECGFEVFNPKLKERKFVRRKLKDAVSPMFPNYIFARFSVPSYYRLIRYSRGVRNVVGAEETPTPVQQNIIDSIRARLVDGYAFVKSERIAPGEPVVIKAGPFQGIDAIFEHEMKGIERVSILLREINARVVVDRAVIEKA